MAAAARRNEFRILSLSGGGYLGLYTAALLARLEQEHGGPLGRRFDLIAGTSVGGMLALALAFEVPMARVVELFRAHGEDMFSARNLPTGAVTRLIDLTRSVMGPTYKGAAHPIARLVRRAHTGAGGPCGGDAGLGIDVATPTATATLQHLALETMASIRPKTLQDFFSDDSRP